MVILRTRNKITDFLMILAWASPFNNPNLTPKVAIDLLRKFIVPIGTYGSEIWSVPSGKLDFFKTANNLQFVKIQVSYTWS